MTADAIQPKPSDQLHDEDIQRRTLEAAAKRIEALAGNELYRKAWQHAARAVRLMKP